MLLHGTRTERYVFLVFSGEVTLCRAPSTPRWWEVLEASGWCPEGAGRLLVIRGGFWSVAASSWWLLEGSWSKVPKAMPTEIDTQQLCTAGAQSVQLPHKHLRPKDALVPER